MAGKKRGPVPLEMIERATEIGGDVLALQRDVYAAGQVRGRRDTAQQVIALVEKLLEDVERTRDTITPAQLDVFDETYRAAAPNPIVAAYFGSAVDTLNRLLRQLRQASAGGEQT